MRPHAFRHNRIISYIMKRQCLFIVLALLLVACGGRHKATKAESTTEPPEEVDIFVFDLERGIAEGPKSRTFNELIDSVAFIPLETHPNALLGNPYTFAKIEDDIYINGGGSTRPAPIYRFDALGRFIKPIISIGRGPNEVAIPVHWYVNSDLKQINIVDMAMKMVIVNAENDEKSSDAVVMSQGLRRVPLNDSTFVSARLLTSRDVPETQLYFTDRTGDVVHSIERNDELANYNVSISERAQVPPYEDYRLWSDYNGYAIFMDIFNDTLYRVKSHREITPHLVFRRGRYMPDPDDTHNVENKRRQAYIMGLMESGDHVFISYTIGDKTWRDVWSKSDGSLMLHTEPTLRNYPFDLFVPYALPDGSIIDLQVVYADRDRVYCVLEALDACKFLPGVREDDNPVILVAKLI